MIINQDQTIAIFGQGYVGLPLAVALVRSGFKVIGIDNNPEIIKFEKFF
jgi:UDP-N-acetyl-D-mannosaminuronate dehydrogenase